MNVFHIPLGVPFLKTLVTGLMTEYREKPEKLSDVHLLLPTRRAVREITDLFLDAADGRSVLLPRLRAVADIDDEELEILLTSAIGTPVSLSPPISSLERQLVLTEMVRARDPGMDYSRASGMAEGLATFLDQMADEGLGFDGLDHLVPDEFAEHWQLTLEFFSILRTVWPEYLRARGLLDPADRRSRILRLLASYWRDHPPTYPVIVAGVSGSLQAVADLMGVVGSLKNGQVILSGFDVSADNEEIARDPQHPFFEIGLLLRRFKLAAADVKLWPFLQEKNQDISKTRSYLWAEVMRPASQVEQWAQLSTSLKKQDIKSILPELKVVECEHAGDEARAIALYTRLVLEDPCAILAIVTPDRDLARRVMAACAKFGIEVNDSGGTFLSSTAPACFLTLMLQVILNGYHPVDVLAFFRHPLFSRSEIDADLIDRLDIAMRGIRPPDNRVDFLSFVQKSSLSSDDCLRLQVVFSFLSEFEVFLNEKKYPISQLIRSQISIAERLCDKDSDGVSRLWDDEAGEVLSSLIRHLLDPAIVLPDITGIDYISFLSYLMRGQMVNLRGVGHPRLALLGVYESRLVHATHMVIAGMNEGQWPMGPRIDPWLSRRMRNDFGLPPDEQRVGRMASDFFQLVQADHILITRSHRSSEGTTVPSRWLQRLETVLSALLGSEDKNIFDRVILGWVRALDEPDDISVVVPKRPVPCPSVALRPRELSATQIEELLRNPYAVYARKILRLLPLDPYDQRPDGRLRGNLLHRILEKYIRDYPHVVFRDAESIIMNILEDELRLAIPDVAARVGLLPRLHRSLLHFLDQDKEWKDQGFIPYALESKWRMDLDIQGISHSITARMDRIDRGKGGNVVVIDYKTGAKIPSLTDMKSGKSPQIPIEMLLLSQGRSVGGKLSASSVHSAVLWPIHFRKSDLKIISYDDQRDILDHLVRDLSDVFAAYLDPNVAYYPVPDPEFAPDFDDYSHLSRRDEWWGVEEKEESFS